MSTTSHPLDAFQGPIRSRVGGVFPGERALFRGKDIHRELKDMHWVEMLYFSASGKRYTPAQVRVLNAMSTYTSYPDTRIWNNRVAALAGTTRSSGNLAVSGAVAITEAKLFGGQSIYRALDFLWRAKDCCDTNEDLGAFIAEYLSRNRSIAGFGRPFVNRDERIAPMMSLLAAEGFDNGCFIRLAKRVEEILQGNRWRYRMNYAGLTAAICGDFGLTPREYYLAASPAFVAGMIPCYMEACEKPAGAIMPVACEDTLYAGPASRPWLNVASGNR